MSVAAPHVLAANDSKSMGFPIAAASRTSRPGSRWERWRSTRTSLMPSGGPAESTRLYGPYDVPYQQMPTRTDPMLASTRSLSGQPIQRRDPIAIRATRKGVKSRE